VLMHHCVTQQCAHIYFTVRKDITLYACNRSHNNTVLNKEWLSKVN